MNANDNQHPEWADRLSDYLAGDMSEVDHQAVERHLAECGPCRRVLEGLREVIERARDLGDIEPPRDLWGGIAATIRAPRSAGARKGARVIALPGAQERGTRDDVLAGQRFTFTAPQLAAASVALIAASALATWVAGPGLGVHSSPPSTTLPTGVVSMASDDTLVPEGLAQELAAQKDVLTQARGKLDPNTVRVLERNLAVIEKAIEDSRNALAQDPGNEFLEDHLRQVYERKLEYLRDVNRISEWVG